MRRIAFFGLLAAVLGSVSAHASTDCGRPGDSPGRFGPFDYRDPTKDEERWLVEKAHFTAYMEEMALYGFTSQQAGEADRAASGWAVVGANIDYTLYAFPNHGRALYAMAVWQLRRQKTEPDALNAEIRGSRMMPADCYFQRAIMFTPNDPVVYHAYGAYLQKAGQLRKAAEQYQTAIRLLPNAPEPHYNLGLLYLSLGDREKASQEAARAYELGYPLQGLKHKLEAANRAAH